MRSLTKGIVFWGLVLAGSTTLPGLDNDSVRALETLKSLQGDWEGTNSNGDPVRARFEVVSEGAAVLERLKVADHGEMVTLYHLDGDRFMLTHYCMSGNQPRMRAVKISSDEIRFDYLDATNLASSNAGHMHRLVLKTAAPDRYSAAWTWHQDGGEAFTSVLNMARAGASAESPRR